LIKELMAEEKTMYARMLENEDINDPPKIVVSL
jgi:hypothetical protein